MQLKRSVWVPAAVGLLAAVTGGWLLQQGTQGNVYLKSRMLQDVIRTVSDRYVEKIDPADLYDLAVEGLLEQLGDPHSTLLRPEDYSELRLQTTGDYAGLGIRIDEKDGWITVVQTLPGTPADRAGLRSGDRLVEVNGESMRGWTSDHAVSVLRGPKGSVVDIKISRVGVDRPIPVRIVRDDIHVQYVTGFMYEPRIGYILQSQFSARSADDILGLVDSLSNEGMRALILDLRDNPGGLLDEGVAVSDLFLRSGSEVVETRSRIADQNESYYAERRPIDPDLPVIVLVNRFSASASEIVAGALQDHDRALVVGEPTFGKGSVQTLYPLPGGNYLKLTTAKWYTPSGRSIHREAADRYVLAMGGGSAAEFIQVPDSASQEAYHTDSGRTVYGGGGITPDLIVRSDTFTTVEQQFRNYLGEQLAAYSDALFSFSVEYANDHPQLEPDFEVTGAMLDQLYGWLEENGIETDRVLFDGTRRVITRQLAINLATVAFDEVTSLRRRLVLDRQLETAVELLRDGRTQEQLFSLAETRQAELRAAARED
ncbi:MAG: S41 family peptidase [Gemmatimonadota bacterium]|nr:MAG: S41 family peptidase [Gemmatimonadota bacterium]